MFALLFFSKISTRSTVPLTGGTMLDDEMDKNNIALTILLKAGAIKECEYCSDYKDNFDHEALNQAYKIGNRMITEKDELVDTFDGDRKALSARIKSAYDNTLWECHCEEVMKE